MKQKQNCGGEVLIKKEDWCNADEIQGTDLDVIQHRIMNLAFSRVCERYKQTNSTALLALCTARRPYSTTPTWKSFIKTCCGKADLIVASNGGLIPLEFESEYPYMTYDAKGEKENDARYIEAMIERMVTFFSSREYNKILLVFRPNKRNIKAGRIACERMGIEYKVLPSPQVWYEMNIKTLSKNFSRTIPSYVADGYLWNPLTHPLIQKEIAEEIN